MVKPKTNVMFYIALAWLPVTCALFRVWVQQDAVRLGYALSAQERRGDALRATFVELEVEAAAARSPAHLAQIAARLGLRPPTPDQLASGTQTSHLARADLRGAVHAKP